MFRLFTTLFLSKQRQRSNFMSVRSCLRTCFHVGLYHLIISTCFLMTAQYWNKQEYTLHKLYFPYFLNIHLIYCYRTVLFSNWDVSRHMNQLIVLDNIRLNTFSYTYETLVTLKTEAVLFAHLIQTQRNHHKFLLNYISATLQGKEVLLILCEYFKVNNICILDNSWGLYKLQITLYENRRQVKRIWHDREGSVKVIIYFRCYVWLLNILFCFVFVIVIVEFCCCCCCCLFSVLFFFSFVFIISGFWQVHRLDL